MALPNIFSEEVSNNVIDRLNNLSPETSSLWGKMNVSQMLAHCNVAYELVYDNNHPKPNAVMKFIIKLMAKDLVTSEKPYKRNSPTGPGFKIEGDRDFELERNRLVEYIRKTQQQGEKAFDGKESHSFGKLTLEQWNNMFYKHLDHHLNQFGN